MRAREAVKSDEKALQGAMRNVDLADGSQGRFRHGPKGIASSSPADEDSGNAGSCSLAASAPRLNGHRSRANLTLRKHELGPLDWRRTTPVPMPQMLPHNRLGRW